MDPTTVATDRLTTSEVSARLERLPWTRYQRGIFLMIATAWLFDSIDLGALTFLLAPISREFGLTATQTGLVGSATFAGMFIGAVAAGMLADRFGRLAVFKYSILVWGVASLLLAFSWDFASLASFRLLLGIGMGAEFPVAAALLSEFMPTAKRGRYVALMEGTWPVGFIFAGVLSFILLSTTLGWRGFFVLQALLAVAALIARRSLPESPRWLTSRGRFDEARATLQKLERNTEKASGRPLPEPQPHLSIDTSSDATGWRTLFSRDYRTRTLASWAMWFCLLGGYYGLTTWLGKLLADSGFDVVKSVGYIVVMALWGIPGFLTAAYLIERVGRKVCLVVFALCAAVAAFLYGTAANLPELMVTGSFLQFFFFGMFSSIFAFTPELFPTRARALGMGSSTAAGRLGSIFGPLIVPLVITAHGPTVVFAASAVLFIAGSAIAMLFLPETRQSVLEEISA
ncbi:MFS transporter [Mycolicibacterium sp. D5.8-2]|jgi:putative MFS transporter|uniref:MFS transporter n=1 Tax=Mycolicibacterium sp. D5.8-2 TaxID=3085903 RepID=UPI00298CD4AB|nr:MFS transporter [Mycolicibacterium sp. D5.8-2]MDW5614111.1 MFS transporter [Mycolicibacterium sp. D5.8-2]